MYEVSNYDATNILVKASRPRVVLRVRRADPAASSYKPLINECCYQGHI
jgi:hypothetical protein